MAAPAAAEVLNTSGRSARDAAAGRAGEAFAAGFGSRTRTPRATTRALPSAVAALTALPRRFGDFAALAACAFAVR
ncbi:MAG: hypothetical protein AB7P21_05465 [Lautropia sp.]